MKKGKERNLFKKYCKQYHRKENKKERRKEGKRTIRPTCPNAQMLNILLINFLFFEYNKKLR